MGHKLSVDPVDDASVYVCHLKERGDLGVPGTTINPNHVSHTPGTIGVSDDHSHPCFDVQEHRICFGRSNGAAISGMNLIYQAVLSRELENMHSNRHRGYGHRHGNYKG